MEAETHSGDLVHEKTIYAFEIGSHYLKISLTQGQLKIEVKCIEQKKNFIAKYTFDALSTVGKNNLEEFDTIQDFTGELIKAARDKNITISE